MKKLIVIIFSLVLVCVLIGCKTTEKMQNINTETRIEYRDKYHRDSVYIRDSVIIYVKGDTVYKDRWHTEWKEKETGDTIILKDTVYIEKEVYKDRSEPPNNWEGTIILIIIALLIYKLK